MGVLVCASPPDPLTGSKKKPQAEASDSAPGSGACAADLGDRVDSEQLSAMKTVGAAGLLAYVQVYDSLEDAAKVVMMKGGAHARDFIGYKYGPGGA